ncbi:MAG: 6-carboxytetrahydropterin synthase QueD [Bdellovibrionia bacterium]
MFELRKTFTFEAAHRLMAMPETHKCRRLHGHSYKATVVVRGETDPQTGVVLDFGLIKEIAEPVFNQLDHQYLNEIEGLANPTSEFVAKWVYDRLESRLPKLWQIVIEETCTSQCRYPVR